MAVTRTEYLVNNGNIDWSGSDVIDALEAAFAGLGWHSGTAKNGVATACLPPGINYPVYHTNSDNYRYAAPAAETEFANYFRYYNITPDGSGGWNVVYVDFISYIFGSASTGNEGFVRMYDCGDLPTGTPMVYRAGTAILPNRVGTSNPMFVDGDTYYVINIPGQEDVVRFADTVEDANNGDFIIPVSGDSSGELGTFEIDLGSNPIITARQGDTINFNNDSTGHPLYIQDTAGAYDSTRVLNDTNYRQITYRSFPDGQGIEIGQNRWVVNDWPQGDYYYVCQNHPGMNGIIRILPSTHCNLTSVGGSLAPYWDYTVPSGGVAGKTDLELRIRRYTDRTSGRGDVVSIYVMNEASGWTENEVFTIPGDAIGGKSPDHDLVFGVNSLTSQQENDRTGICSLTVTNLGAGNNFYQKYSDGAILRLESDDGKTYGHTYYGFRLASDEDHQIYIGSGADWQFLNFSPSSSEWDYQGRWTGDLGMDMPSYNIHLDNNTNYYHRHNFARSTTPNQYPLKIVTHQATSPQDTNFATISFVQTTNGIDYAYLTFSPLKGSAVGANLWDLEYVWNGTYLVMDDTTYSGDENIKIATYFPWIYNSGDEETNDTSSVRREAFYGFKRDPNQSSYNQYLWEDNYSNNLYTYQGNNTSQSVGYFRNSSFDSVTLDTRSSTNLNKNDAVVVHSVDSNADYYRAFKGIPMNSKMMPCPYYLPDDFTIIQFAVNPGATAFRFGDTITVSDSEVYEIVQVNYSTNQLGLDGIDGNTSKGIAFCARTT